MNPFLLALPLALAATLCWIAASAGRPPGQIGWWAPVTGRGRNCA